MMINASDKVRKCCLLTLCASVCLNIKIQEGEARDSHNTNTAGSGRDRRGFKWERSKRELTHQSAPTSRGLSGGYGGVSSQERNQFSVFPVLKLPQDSRSLIVIISYKII